MNLRPTFLPLVLLLAGCTSTLPTQSKFFTDWPAGMSPTEIGARVADNFITRTLEVDQGKRPYVIYPEVINWYGALEVAKLSRNAELRQRLIAKFDPLLTPEGAKKISPDAHVDFRVFGGVPLELYLQTKDEKYLTIGKGLADKQWAAPTPDGVTREARYWVDDIYMISLVQVQAFRATHDPKYLDHAAATLDIAPRYAAAATLAQRPQDIRISHACATRVDDLTVAAGHHHRKQRPQV